MRTLIIPDVHENIEPVLGILGRERPDKTVFLGDWVDRFPSQPGDLRETLSFLRANVDNEDFTFLLGNHDAPYMYTNPALLCSGHQIRQQAIFDFFLSPEARAKFRLFSRVDGWLLSHAGFNRELLALDIETTAEWCFDALLAGNMHPMVAAGRARGGIEPMGGVTWLDWDKEFRDVGVKQIVGHTAHKEPQCIGGSWCLDTRLKHYGVIEDGDFTILNIDGTEQRIIL